MKRILIILLAWLSLIPAMAQQTENAYMDFLYQYMALPDQTDYSRDFYLKNVRLSLQFQSE